MTDTKTKHDASALDLPEHLANPFTARLGHPLSMAERFKLLDRPPRFDAKTREYAAHLRRYCVLNLFDFVHPRPCQLVLVERIGMLIRAGYRTRNPITGGHRKHILDAARRSETKNIEMPAKLAARAKVTGLTLLGHPGMGKSLTVDIALEAYPGIIEHKKPYRVVQVPWLKIECPSRGGNKQFCISFFDALGKRVGQNYLQTYAKGNRGADAMLLDVQQLCHVHALGILVIDELQHASANVEGPEPLMNFLVTLNNVIGIPVMLVGTMKAESIIGQEFHAGRRSAGLGQPTWMRLGFGKEWEKIVEKILRYQWTIDETPYSPELSKALYHESQGIVDILVKLVALCQFRAISNGETKGLPETITPKLVGDVARDEFRVIRPMMNALRNNVEGAIMKYQDLKEFHDHVDSVVSRELEIAVEELQERRDAERKREREAALDREDDLAPIRGLLASSGLAADVVERVLAEALRSEPSRDMLPIVRRVMALVDGDAPPKPAPKRPPAKPAPRAATPPAGSVGCPGDLRTIAAAAKSRGQSVHAGLVEAGVSQPVSRIIAA